MNVCVDFGLPYLHPYLAVPAACVVSGVASLLLAILCRFEGPSYWHIVLPATALNALGACGCGDEPMGFAERERAWHEKWTKVDAG